MPETTFKLCLIFSCCGADSISTNSALFCDNPSLFQYIRCTKKAPVSAHSVSGHRGLMLNSLSFVLGMFWHGTFGFLRCLLFVRGPRTVTSPVVSVQLEMFSVVRGSGSFCGFFDLDREQQFGKVVEGPAKGF